MFDDVKIKTNGPVTNIWINGQELHGVTKVQYKAEVDALPEIIISSRPVSSLKINNAEITFDDESVRQAIVILRNRLMKCDELYYGFLASIESVLAESGTCTNIHDLSVEILDRVIGEDVNP